MAHRRLIVLLTSLAPILQASAKQKAFQSTMSLTYPPPMIFSPPSGTHQSTLIFLHGNAQRGLLSRLMTFTFNKSCSISSKPAWRGYRTLDRQPGRAQVDTCAKLGEAWLNEIGESEHNVYLSLGSGGHH